MHSVPSRQNVLKALPLCCLLALQLHHTAAGLLPLISSKASEAPSSSSSPGEQLGSIEYLPNGTLILRSADLPHLLLFRGVMGAALQPAHKWNIKIYGDGVEHKFPPFLERIIQRIQSYFSVYKYTDTSRPAQQPVVVQGDVTTTVANYLTTATRPVASTTTTAATSLQITNALDAEGSGASAPIVVQLGVANDNDDYNEFIEVGEHDDFITVGED